MIQESALVLSTSTRSASQLTIPENIARLRVQRKSACDSCQLKSGCGQSTMTKLSGNQCIEFEVSNELGARKGDLVVISIPESGLLNASLMVYFFPLLSMILFSLGASSLTNTSDVGISIAGILGLSFGFLAARSYGKRQEANPDFLPKMVSVISNPIEVIVKQS